MSDYTVELRKIEAWPSLNNVLSTYPIYDEAHRVTLNTLFIERYRFRDIGYETAEMFIQRLRSKFLEIMPYYNQLYESTTKTFDPLVNVSMDTTGSTTDTGSSTDTSTTSGTTSGTGHSTSTADAYDMPQTQLDQTGDYLASRSVSVSDSTNSGESGGTESRTGESTGKSDMLGTSKGLSGVSGSQLLMEYRMTMLNIDAMIVNDLGVLFMQVWRPSTYNY